MLSTRFPIIILLFNLSLAWTQPDLKGEIVYISHQEMYAGEVVVARSLISNIGKIQTPENKGIFAHYYLSSDEKWDGTDIYLGDNQIHAILEEGKSFEEIIRIFNIPDSCPHGQYYLLYIMDPENLIEESREANNLDILQFIEIYHTRPQGVELTGLISNIEKRDVHPGDRINARSYVKNVGTASTSDSASFLTFYMLCPNDKWDENACMRIGGELFGDPIAPGAQILLDENIGIPDTLSPGTYSIWYKIDAQEEIAEFDETNNIRKWGTIGVTIPWYLRWWAILSYFVLSGIAIFHIIKFIIRQRRIRRSLREAKRIKEIEQFKSRFYTNITHEFRTPLTVILGMTEELKRGDQMLSQEDYKGYLNNIETSSKSLLLLINQLLELAKLESDNLVLHPIQKDIIPFLRYMYSSFDSYAESRKIKYAFKTSLEKLQMDFDPVYLQLILSNLISNGIKFTNEGGSVEVRVERRDVRGEMREEKDIQKEDHSLLSPLASRFSPLASLIITVKDTGIGIPKNQQERIFDRFYQVDNSITRMAGGTGIGLALTRELVHLMGGFIDLQSAKGEGSSFIVFLPIQRNAPERANVLLEGAYEQHTFVSNMKTSLEMKKGKQVEKVLIIEDHLAVVDYLKVCLIDRYQISVAHHGKSGLEKAIEEVPDLIITDVMMPEMDGFELCEKLKIDIRTSHIPIIMLTAKATTDDKLQGLSKGADAYLTKPFNRDELLIRIHQLLLLRKRLHRRYKNLKSSLPLSNKATQVEDLFLKRLSDIIEENISNSELTVPLICAKVGMSHTQLHRKVKALTDKSISRFVRYVRLKKGRTLLETTDLNIAEIAYDVGFKDPNYFSRTFVEEFGITPTELKEKL